MQHKTLFDIDSTPENKDKEGFYTEGSLGLITAQRLVEKRKAINTKTTKTITIIRKLCQKCYYKSPYKYCFKCGQKV